MSELKRMSVGPHSTDDELREADAEITLVLKGSMPNYERAWYVEDRKNIRAELAKRRSKVSQQQGSPQARGQQNEGAES